MSPYHHVQSEENMGAWAHVFVILAACACCGLSLKCYLCDTTTVGCSDPFNTHVNEARECPASSVCAKYNHTSFYRNDTEWYNQTILTRSCFSLGNNTCDKLNESLIAQHENNTLNSCRVCSEDQCNSAPSFPSLPLLGLIAVMVGTSIWRSGQSPLGV